MCDLMNTGLYAEKLRLRARIGDLEEDLTRTRNRAEYLQKELIKAREQIEACRAKCPEHPQSCTPSSNSETEPSRSALSDASSVSGSSSDPHRPSSPYDLGSMQKRFPLRRW